MHVLLKSLIPIAETIGKTFGNRCEVVLHDLTIPEKSVVYTVNGLSLIHISEPTRH